MDEHFYEGQQVQTNSDFNSSCNPSQEHRCDQERSESDATHPLLRLDRYPIEFMLCLSCNLRFQNNSFSEICAHYSVYPHPQSFQKCLYCNGNVYYYLHPTKLLPKVFHFCSKHKSSTKKY